MFHGRERELNELNRLYRENRFQLFVLYGRRRVGKTALLKEFCKDKPTVFYSSEISNDKLNLEKFSAQVLRHYGETGLRSFSAWENSLEFIHERQKDEPLVLVFDEFPYLAEKNRAFLSMLQHMIDHRLQSGKVFLVLCGSYVGFMERDVLGAKSPLFGRRTAQLRLKPFDYPESRAFLSGFSPEEQCMFYGALGGIPLYLGKVDGKKTFRDNLVDLFLRPTSSLYEEPIFLLREELQQPGVYNAVIEAIASGASKANEIAGKTGETAAKCLKYIHVLSELGIVSKETPFGEKESSRKTIYNATDFLFRFWYRYVAPNRTLIENDAWQIVWEKKIAPDYSNHMGAVFEQICKEYLLHQNSRGKLPFLFTSIGRWWGSDPKTKTQTEIDLVASDGTEYLICECKWRNEKMKKNALAELRAKAEIFLPAEKKPWLALFSKSGFTDTVRQEAKTYGHVLLFTLDDMISGEE